MRSKRCEKLFSSRPFFKTTGWVGKYLYTVYYISKIEIRHDIILMSICLRKESDNFSMLIEIKFCIFEGNKASLAKNSKKLL